MKTAVSFKADAKDTSVLMRSLLNSKSFPILKVIFPSLGLVQVI
jgi:hypothetical protein